MPRKTFEIAAKILASEFFCDTPEQIHEELDMTAQEISDVLNSVPIDFVQNCRDSFEKAIISA